MVGALKRNTWPLTATGSAERSTGGFLSQPYAWRKTSKKRQLGHKFPKCLVVNGAMVMAFFRVVITGTGEWRSHVCWGL